MKKARNRKAEPKKRAAASKTAALVKAAAATKAPPAPPAAPADAGARPRAPRRVTPAMTRAALVLVLFNVALCAAAAATGHTALPWCRGDSCEAQRTLVLIGSSAVVAAVTVAVVTLVAASPLSAPRTAPSALGEPAHGG